MTAKEAEAYLHSLIRIGEKPGLYRIQLLLDVLGNPEEKLKFIHIAGTNGKGSAVAMTASILKEAGYRVGMNISPFVVEFRERFQIDGEYITEEELGTCAVVLRDAIEELEQRGEHISEFEAVTALALYWFAKRECDLVCLEVGIGGRDDVTNVIPDSLASVIMAISYDHMESLGETLREIAGHKAGIMRENGTTVCYPIQDKEVTDVLKAEAEKLHNDLVIPDISKLELTDSRLAKTEFVYKGVFYELFLPGLHQVCNAITVIELCGVLRNKGYMISEEEVRAGLSGARFPARTEVMREDPLVIIDGAHNPQGAEVLLETLKKTGHKFTGIVGMLSDKEYKKVAQIMTPVLSKGITVKIPYNKRALSAEEMRDSFMGRIPVVTAGSVKQAIQIALEEGESTVVFGSLYLASDARRLFLEMK